MKIRRKVALSGVVLGLCLISAACGESQQGLKGAKAKGAQDATVWYADVVGANPLVTAVAQAINDPLAKSGAKMTRSFSVNNTTGDIDLSVQAEAVTRATASKPSAIIFYLLDSKALKPQIERARKQGIPVFSAFGKPEFPVNAWITIDDDRQGYLSAKYLADHLPKGAKVAIIGGPPTPNVEAELAGAQRALKEAGATIVGDLDQQRNLKDNSAGGQAIMQGILQRNPDVDGVFVFNDDSALGAIAAAKQANKKIKFTSRNGSTEAIAAVKAGDLLATCDIGPIAVGRQIGQAVVDHLSGKTTYSDSYQLPTPDASDCLVTKENVGNRKPYDEIITYRNLETG